MKNADKPAYPVEADKLGTTNGLTKREMFAMAAMQGILASSSDRGGKWVADNAVLFADELLKQLES